MRGGGSGQVGMHKQAVAVYDGIYKAGDMCCVIDPIK